MTLPISIDAEFEHLIPPLSEEERTQLEASLKAEGCRDALVCWNNNGTLTLVDGHNRYALCKQHGIEYRITEREFDSREDVIIWIVNNQLARRNLTAFARAELALKQKAAFAEKRRLNMVAGKALDPVPNLAQGKTRDDLASVAEVGHETIRKVEIVGLSAFEGIKRKARDGELSVDRAFKLTRELQDAGALVVEAVTKHGIDDLETVRVLKTLKPDSDTLREVVASGFIQPGDETEAVSVTAGALALKAALQQKSDIHKFLALDEKPVKAHDLSILHSSESNEWYTPARYIEAARTVLGGIDLDPASCEYANTTVKAAHYFSEQDDGFAQEWRGRVWLNPPYGRELGESNQGRWSAKLIEEYRAGRVTAAILLVNAVTDRVWFQALWDHAICFTDHRVHFYNEQKEAEDTSPSHGNVFVYIGNDCQKFADAFQQFGVIVTNPIRRTLNVRTPE